MSTPSLALPPPVGALENRSSESPAAQLSAPATQAAKTSASVFRDLKGRTCHDLRPPFSCFKIVLSRHSFRDSSVRSFVSGFLLSHKREKAQEVKRKERPEQRWLLS